MTKAMLCFTFPIIRVIPVSGRVRLLLETPRAAWATLRLILLKAEGTFYSVILIYWNLVMNNQNHRWINLCSRKLIDVHLEDALPEETSLNIWPDFFWWGADATLDIALEKICFSCQPEVPCRRSWTRNKQQVPFHILRSEKKKISLQPTHMLWKLRICCVCIVLPYWADLHFCATFLICSKKKTADMLTWEYWQRKQWGEPGGPFHSSTHWY